MISELKSKPTNLIVKCPICNKDIILKTTRKEGIVWGMCVFDLFRGFFPEHAIKQKLEEGKTFKKEIYECIACGKKYKRKGNYLNHLQIVKLDKERHPRIYNRHKRAGLI